MSPPESRPTLARPDLAAADLEGLVAAKRYGAARRRQLGSVGAAIYPAPDLTAEVLDELIYGEQFDVLETRADFHWGRACRDGYVGFVHKWAFARHVEAPTHWVRALRTYAFAEPSIKAPSIGPYSMNSLVHVDVEEGDFARAGKIWFWRGHLAPVGLGFERDWAGVAERFLGAPYLWGGRTSLGLDCSGLVQQALYACGRACPRDTDQQAHLGEALTRDQLQRGDLVVWRGHIGLMLDETRLLHANAHHMAVAIEPLADAIARIAAGPAGDPTTFRRL